VVTARYVLSPYIKKIRFFFKGLNNVSDTEFVCIMSAGRINPSSTKRVKKTYSRSSDGLQFFVKVLTLVLSWMACCLTTFLYFPSIETLIIHCKTFTHTSFQAWQVINPAKSTFAIYLHRSPYLLHRQPVTTVVLTSLRS
jgi:uncharacterized protein with PQ loop repeat